MFCVFMLLFETFINRLDRFVLVGRKRLERRELEQIGVLELFNRMNRVVFFAKLCPEVSEPLAILRPLKIIELGIAVVGIGDLVFFVGTEQLNKSILELERCGLVEGGIVDQKGRSPCPRLQRVVSYGAGSWLFGRCMPSCFCCW